METRTLQFIDYLWTMPNLMIVSSVWILLNRFRKAFPEVSKHSFYARLQPLLPILLASGAVWIPGAIDAPMAVASRVFLGITLGFGAAYANKLLRQTVLGKDSRIS